jgi:ribonuclease E
MSNAEKPAEETGGIPAAAAVLVDLPARVRVHALAKLLGVHSREVVRGLSELGEIVRSAQSSVTREVAQRLAEALNTTAGPEPSTLAVSNAVSDVGGSAQPAVESTPGATNAPEAADSEVSDSGRKTAKRTDTRFSSEPEPVTSEPQRGASPMPVFAAPSPIFLPPEPVASAEKKPKRERPAKTAKPENSSATTEVESADQAVEPTVSGGKRADVDSEEDAGSRRRRRRGRRGRGRGKGSEEDIQLDSGQDNAMENPEPVQKQEGSPKQQDVDPEEAAADSPNESLDEGNKRRRRRRRRKGGDDSGTDLNPEGDDSVPTVVHVRDGKGEAKPDADVKSESDTRSGRDGVRSVRGSTRLEAKRQRRRDGREAGRRRAPILSEAEFLARRESVERTMVVAEKGDTSQVAVLEDGVLVEHFVTSAGSGSIVGNVYLGRVQNVLPSMEAAFVDIGRGRNAVLYAGEVDWDAAGLEGKARKIEQALATGDNVLVQVTKDPVGHKGARLTTQISLPGRFLVYVPAGGATGISRKLPENERRRLKDLLKHIVPEDAGVIIRTASEGISEEELSRDVQRLQAQWKVIKEKAEKAQGSAKKSAPPVMLYEEPDLLVKVVRDLFTEDFVKLEVQGTKAWDTIGMYVEQVAPDLADRLHRYVGTGDVLAEHRIDEQITKALDRKVWLPSGGYLVIDRTEAMTVIDVNTGKFTGSGGNLEETVTRNNLESAEEIVRQLRLRDIGGIIVIDFIDMVLESNRDLVLRRLTECLGRDRTRHQVAEVTSLGLVQMTRKRIGTGLLEAFSTPCEHCKGRGVVVSTDLGKTTVQSHNHGSGNSHPDNHGGNGHGNNGHKTVESRDSKRKNGRKAAEETHDEVAPQETPVNEHTVEQHKSVVSAVQAMAHASKIAASKSGDPETSTEVAAQAPDSVEVRNGHATGHVDEAKDVRTRLNGAASRSRKNRDVVSKEASLTEPVKSEPIKAGSGQAGSGQEESEVAIPTPATGTVRRRSRRAASRPAGPPVSVPDQN